MTMTTKSDAANGTLKKSPSKGDEKMNGALETQKRPASSAYAVAHATMPEWINIAAMLGLIFGGCCANVFALEAIIKEAPGSGTLITFTQFSLTAMFSLKPHLDFSRGIKHLYLKPRAIPFQRWLLYTAIFLTINVLNNKAFNYKISVPLHIILRSAGPVATMTVGYVAGKRYTPRQIVAVALLFLGVAQAAVADAQSKGAQTSFVQSDVSSRSDFLIGFGILCLALLLSAIMGVYTDRTYAKYGRNHWNENLFYSHTLSLPFFMLYWPDLMTQSQTLLSSPSMTMFMANPHQSGTFTMVHQLMERTPIQLVLLLMNGFTQYLCIRGVNLLSAKSSSLTVTIVLNVRKLISLMLSIWLFGNRLAPGVLLGALLVFIGGGLYAMPSGKPAVQEKNDSKKEL
jgi:solute carrier family 35 (UDP-xylose/UDP-N-acetylglucosamine transporter), member B4